MRCTKRVSLVSKSVVGLALGLDVGTASIIKR